MLAHSLEERLEAQGRLRQISNSVVLLKFNLEQYPANQYLIDKLEAERDRIIVDFIYVCYDVDGRGAEAEEPQPGGLLEQSQPNEEASPDQ